MAIQKLLVANRGEIAVRIFRTCRELGIATVAVATPTDAGALHTRVADETLEVASYLDAEEHIRAAALAGADAVHPGYGFLSESPAFASAVQAAGLVWVGPPPEALAAGGDKLESKRLAAAAGVPVVPTGQPEALGYPLLVKAAAGGGGRGMRIVRRADELADALAAARREAKAAFGDDTVFCERYVERPRHIEVQLLADAHGRVLALGERECSIQRRHQKVLEEAPSPALDDELRRRLADAAVAFARAIGYVGAGTAEFMVSGRDLYFLELNARIQVEHPVTEAVTGVDIVEQQLLIAEGGHLAIASDNVSQAAAGARDKVSQAAAGARDTVSRAASDSGDYAAQGAAGASDTLSRGSHPASDTVSRAAARASDTVLRGHAVEVRLYAEDPRTFLPQAGRIERLRLPAGIRVDAGVAEGDEVGTVYDPMIAKLIAHGRDRAEALDLLAAALAETEVVGVTTNLPFLRWLVAHPAVRAGETTTAFLDEHPPLSPPSPPPSGPWRGAFRLNLPTPPSTPAPDVDATAHAHGPAAEQSVVTAPMPGTVIRVLVAPGDVVEARRPLVVVEAMKMETPLVSPYDAVVRAVHVAEGDTVVGGQPLVELDD